MKSRIDVVTGFGIIGLEVRKNLDCLTPDSYAPEIGNIVCYFGHHMVGSSLDVTPTAGEAKKYMKQETLAHFPLYLYEDHLVRSIAVRTSEKGEKCERRVSENICGYLYLSENDLDEHEDRSKAIRQFRASADKITAEFSAVLNHEVYEYQAYLNFKPIPKERKLFYGDRFDVMREISSDFLNTIHHPAFEGDGAQYLLEHIEWGRTFADAWIMAPEEYETAAKYLGMCMAAKEKEMLACVRDGDEQGLNDIKRSIGEICMGTGLFLHLKHRLDSIEKGGMI